MNKRLLSNPVKYVLYLTIITIVLYLWGPYDYTNINRNQLLTFLIICNLFIYWGFKSGVTIRFKLRRNTSDLKRDFADSYSITKLVNMLFWVSLLVSFPQFIIYTKAYDLNIGRLLSNAALFFSDAYGIYSARHSVGNATGIWQYINYIVVLFGPLYWAYTPIAMLLWDKLKTWRKILTIYIWVLYLLQYLCTGTNVGFFDFIITFVCVMIVKQVVTSKKSIYKRKRSIQQRLGITFLVLCGVIILFYIFDVVMGSRIGEQYLSGGGLGAYRYTFNNDSIIWRIAPSSMKAVLSYVTRYLCGGYNALVLAFDAQFKSTYGLGYSWFLLDETKNIFPDLWSRTYNMQIDSMFGFDYYSSWHTAYLWFANDVSFIGVPFVLYLLYYLFGRWWKSFVENKDLIGFLGFMLFVKFSYFISANNQVFQNSNTLFAFWVLFIFTILGRQFSIRVDEYGKI